MVNDLRFVARIVDLLSAQSLDVWLAGGWAEELHGLITPREHHNVDLLYRAESFEKFDSFVTATRIDEIRAKHFPHKRAFEIDGVMVELILIDANTCTTLFWGSEPYQWPADTLPGPVREPKLVSAKALQQYRTRRPPVSPLN